MGRTPCCEKRGLRKGTWTPEEDKKLLSYIEQHGYGSWRSLPAKAGLERCDKSCRLRWINYLRPDIKRGKFSLQEEQTVIQLHALLGNRWAAIASHLPKRTDNEIKNYWNTHLKKRLTKMGIDPSTHKPKTNIIVSPNLSHTAQWESARLEAESRFIRHSAKHKLLHYWSPPPYNSAHFAKPLTLSHDLEPITVVPPCLDILKAWHRTWMTTARSSNAAAGNADFFNSTASVGSLESPTSTLHFSDYNTMSSTTPRAHVNVSIGENLPLIKPKDNIDYRPEVGAITLESTEMAGNMMQQFNHTYTNNIEEELYVPIDAAECSLITSPSFMEGFPDADTQGPNDPTGSYGQNLGMIMSTYGYW